MKYILLLMIPVINLSCQQYTVKPSIAHEVRHFFSNSAAPDVFQLKVQGDDLLAAEITFTIMNSSGDVLYREIFPANALIGYALNWETATTAEKEAVIRTRINAFFSEDRFEKPAIKAGDQFDAEYSDQQAWEEIKSDPSAIGFIYYLEGEDIRHIAFSKRTRKVVMYFNCC